MFWQIWRKKLCLNFFSESIYVEVKCQTENQNKKGYIGLSQNNNFQIQHYANRTTNQIPVTYKFPKCLISHGYPSVSMVYRLPT